MMRTRTLTLFVFCVLALIVMTQWIQRRIEGVMAGGAHVSSVAPLKNTPPPTTVRYRKRGQIISRKDRLSLNRDHVESIFYLQEKEIARQKIADGETIESFGEIPDGKIHFVNESKETHGTEYYSGGRKDGPSQTYFADGKLSEEAYYRGGHLLWKKEYYSDGGLRLELDYQDARRPDRDECEASPTGGCEASPTGGKEVGTGKVYFRDGTLKYEWHLTNSDKTGYKKSYSQDGQLRAALYFDEQGQLVE